MDKTTKPSWLVDADENDPLYTQVREMALHVASGGPIKTGPGFLFERMLHTAMVVMRWGRELLYVPDGKPQLHVLWMRYEDNSGLLYIAPQPEDEAPIPPEERAYQYSKRVHDEKERERSLAQWELRAKENREELRTSARWVRKDLTNPEEEGE